MSRRDLASKINNFQALSSLQWATEYPPQNGTAMTRHEATRGHGPIACRADMPLQVAQGAGRPTRPARRGAGHDL